jgi:Uma2 family endonuclease
MIEPEKQTPASEPCPPGPAEGNGQEEIPIIAMDLPVMFEDEGQEEMGETQPHTAAVHILLAGVIAHLAPRPKYQVFSDLNVYYHPLRRWAYVSPDVMVVEPFRRLPDELTSYRIGVQGPAPLLTIEVLSRRSFQQQDLTNKADIYAFHGVAEYVLVDPTGGQFLPEIVLVKRLQNDGGWLDDQDRDGGITTRLGFRIVMEEDNLPRVIDAQTGRKYVRPNEAQALVDEARQLADQEAQARRLAEEKIRALEEELNRLRKPRPNGPVA